MQELHKWYNFPILANITLDGIENIIIDKYHGKFMWK